LENIHQDLSFTEDFFRNHLKKLRDLLLRVEGFVPESLREGFT
jgi:hypothetical protein